MGEVFFAWAYGVARTRKPVVVKVLRAEMLAEPGAPEMFVEEGRLSLHLNHSNIVSVFDFGKADDRYFMAMEFVDGLHVGELRKKAGGRLSPDHAAFVAMEVCLALDYAHRLKDESGKPLQIVHRDVTPSNILISREGEVKLADFGIARAVGRSQHTQAGQIRGKVRYMSPEAARGEPLDLRADLFSLGTILFELLTGRRAFDAKGGREAILKQIVSGRAPAPSVVMDVHPALDAVVLKATAPKREERYPDAFAMHRAIEEACRDAGLNPSRGAFLQFLRGLESAEAAAEANSWSSAPADPVADAAQVALSPRPAVSITPTPGRGEGTAAVAPPPIGANTVGRGMPGVVPDRNAPREARTMTPSGARHTPSKPSSTEGTIPPPIEGPQSTVLPTGVADPVLFTLVVGEMTPDAPNAELPVFEVTREGMPLDLDRVPGRRTLEPDDDPPRKSSDVLTAPGMPSPVIPASSAASEPTVPPQRPNPSVRRVMVEPSNPEAARAPSEERTTDRRVDESERPTAEGRERVQSQAAETVVRAAPPLEATRAPSARGMSATPATEDRVRPPSYRAALPAREEVGAVETVAGDPHWKVRRVEPPSRVSNNSGSSEPLFPHAARGPRSPASVFVLGLGLVAILVLGIVVGLGGPGKNAKGTASPRTTAGPQRTSLAEITPTLAVPASTGAQPLNTAAGAATTTTNAVPTTSPSAPPTALAISSPAPTQNARPSEAATPVETRVAVATPVAVPTTPVARPTHAVVRATPPPATPVAAPGILVVNTQPWTEFTIAGRSYHTPLQGEKVPPGHYVLALHSRFNPKLDRTVEVDVRSGETTRVILDLTRP